MAYSAQFLEGLCALYESMHVNVGRPVLFCDNRAAVHLASGSGEWRTKALVNRVLGVRSLVQLGVITLSYKATAEMQADALTKFMGAKTLKQQRELVGCAPLHGAP